MTSSGQSPLRFNPLRHPELVSGSIPPPAPPVLMARWMLKRVQHDELGGGGALAAAHNALPAKPRLTNRKGVKLTLDCVPHWDAGARDHPKTQGNRRFTLARHWSNLVSSAEHMSELQSPLLSPSAV